MPIFEGSRAEPPDRGGAERRGRTARGRVRAGAVVLACGAALAGHRPLRRRLTVTSSHMVITEPVPDVLEELGWTGGECITDSRAMVHYFRTTPDGRIAFGWGGGRVVPGARLNGRAEVDPGVVAEVERHLVRFFPALAGRRIEHAWGGPIDVSPTHLPDGRAASTAAASTTPSATRATGSGPRISPGGSSPRWRWTAATSRRAWRSSTRPPAACPPSRCATSAGRWSAAALVRARAPRGAGPAARAR